jgi:hypothetical protein
MMENKQMNMIADEVFRAYLPIGINDPAMGRTRHDHTVGRAKEQIQIPAHIAKIILQ